MIHKTCKTPLEDLRNNVMTKVVTKIVLKENDIRDLIQEHEKR